MQLPGPVEEADAQEYLQAPDARSKQQRATLESFLADAVTGEVSYSEASRAEVLTYDGRVLLVDLDGSVAEDGKEDETETHRPDRGVSFCQGCGRRKCDYECDESQTSSRKPGAGVPEGPYKVSLTIPSLDLGSPREAIGAFLAVLRKGEVDELTFEVEDTNGQTHFILHPTTLPTAP